MRFNACTFILGALVAEVNAQDVSVNGSTGLNSTRSTTTQTVNLVQVEVPTLNSTQTTAQNASITGVPKPSFSELPANGTGFAYASVCADQHKLFSDASTSWRQSGITGTTYSIGTTLVTVQLDDRARPTYMCSTLCDGHCRAYNYSYPATAIGVMQTWGTTYLPTFSLTKPSCTVANADCSSLLKSYVCATSLWFKDKTTRPWIESHRYCHWKTMTVPTVSPTVGSCRAFGLAFGTPNTVTLDEMQKDCGRCTIFAGHENVAHAQLMYFPASTTTNRSMFCATTTTDTPIYTTPHHITNLTITPMQTVGHSSAVVNGTTYWDNYAYIRYPYIEALDNCGNVGPMLTNALVTVPPSDILSQRGDRSFNAYSFNFGDFIEPVPYMAWRGQNRCWEWAGDDIAESICGVVHSGVFSPQIHMPQQVRTLRSDWLSCTVSWLGVIDPPIALSAVPFVLSSSTPVQNPVEQTTPAGSADPVTTTAVPGGGVGDPGDPQETGQPGGGNGGGNGGGGSPGQGNPNRPQPQPGQPAQPNQPGATGAPNRPPSWTSFTTVGSETVWIDPSQPGAVRIGNDNTLTTGGPGTNIAGVSVTLGIGNLVIGASTVALPQPLPGGDGFATSTPTATQAVITLGSGTLVTAAPTGLIIDGQTLQVGGPSVVMSDGKTISLGTGGVVIMEPTGTSTVPFTTLFGGPFGGGDGNPSGTGTSGGEGTNNAASRPHRLGLLRLGIALACIWVSI